MQRLAALPLLLVVLLTGPGCSTTSLLSSSWTDASERCAREATRDTEAWGVPVKKGQVLFAVCGGASGQHEITPAKYEEVIYDSGGYAWAKPIDRTTWHQVYWRFKTSTPEPTPYVEMVQNNAAVGLRPAENGTTNGPMVLDVLDPDAAVVKSVALNRPVHPDDALRPLSDNTLFVAFQGIDGGGATLRILNEEHQLGERVLPPNITVYRSRYIGEPDLRRIAAPLDDGRYLLYDETGAALDLPGARAWRPLTRRSTTSMPMPQIYGWLAEFATAEGDVDLALTHPDGTTIVTRGIASVELSSEQRRLGNWYADLLLHHPDSSVSAIPLTMLNRHEFRQTRPRPPEDVEWARKWARLDARQLREEMTREARRAVAEWRAEQRELEREEAEETWDELWSKNYHSWWEREQLLAAARLLGGDALLAYGTRYSLTRSDDIQRACASNETAPLCQQAAQQAALHACLTEAREDVAAEYASAVRAGARPTDGTWTGTWRELMQRAEERCRAEVGL